MPNPTSKRVYHVPMVSKALDILELIQNNNQPLSIEAIYQKTKFSKTTVYRIVRTLVYRGYVAQQDGLYRPLSRPRKMRFGFAAQSGDMPFSQAVTASLESAAASSGVELLVFDNRYDAQTAIRNAKKFVDERVHLVIEFQIEQQVAPIVADILAKSRIQLIAVEIPHPHATFFGVDNYRVGFEAGEYLGRHAKKVWKGHVQWVLGLDIAEAGPLVQSRITGAFEGVRSLLSQLPPESFIRLNGHGLSAKSHDVILAFLRKHPKDRILIAAADDTSALGALAAVKELRREKYSMIVGQDCIPEAIDEMRRPGTPLIASVSHEAHTYGPQLIRLGLALLEGQRVSPFNYVDHRLVTAEEVVQEPV